MAVTDLITAERYNALQRRISAILGTSNTGYGISLNSSQVNAKTNMQATDIQKLRRDMVLARQHQTGVPVSANDLPIISGGVVQDSVYSLYYEPFMTNIESYKLDMAVNQSTTATELVSVRSMPWNSIINHVTRFKFATELDAIYFFNAGGEILANATLDNPVGSKSIAWNSFLARLGTIKIRHSSTISTGTNTSTQFGYSSLVDAGESGPYKAVFTGNDTGIYALNSYVVSVKKWKSNNTLNVDVNVTFMDNFVDVPSDISVSGTLTSKVTYRIASGDNVSLLDKQPIASTVSTLAEALNFQALLSPSTSGNVVYENTTVTATISKYGTSTANVWYLIGGDILSSHLESGTAMKAPITFDGNGNYTFPIKVINDNILNSSTMQLFVYDRDPSIQSAIKLASSNIITTTDPILITLNPSIAEMDEITNKLVTISIDSDGISDGNTLRWIVTNAAGGDVSDRLEAVPPNSSSNAGYSTALVAGKASFQIAARNRSTSDGDVELKIVASLLSGGNIVATSSPLLLWLRDTAIPAITLNTFSDWLTPGVSEGSSISIGINTANIPLNAKIDWKITNKTGNITASDFEPSVLAGSVYTISSTSTPSTPVTDTTPPTFDRAQVYTDNPTKIYLVYSEYLDISTVFTSAFIVKVDGTEFRPGGISIVSDAHYVIALVISPSIRYGQTVTVSYTPPAGNDGIKDLTGNRALAFTDKPVVILAAGGTDTTAPVFGTSTVSSTGLVIALGYDEELNTTTASPSDFIVNVDGLPVTISSVTVTTGNNFVRLWLQVAIRAGQAVTVRYTPPSGENAIKDLAGNKAASIPTTNVPNGSAVTGGSDTIPPLFDRAMVYTRDSTKVYIHYIENLNISSVTKNAFQVKVDGVAATSLSISIPAYALNVIELTVNTSMVAGRTVTVSYTPPGGNNGIKDLAGNLALGFTDVPVVVDAVNGGSGGTPTSIDGGWYATNQIPARRDGTNLASDSLYGIALLSGNYVTVSTQFDMPGVFHGSLTYYFNNAISQQINLQDNADTRVHCTSIAIDSSNNVYIAGDITYDGFVRKYSSTGTLIWAKKLNLSIDSWYNGYARVHIDHTGNMILAGNYGIDAFNNLGTNPGFIAKYDNSATPELLWARSLAECYITGCAITNTNTIGVVGHRVTNYVVAAYDNNGGLLWKRSGDVNQVEGLKISSDSAGNFYVSGTKSNQGISPRYGFIAKYTANGALEWTKALSANTMMKASAVDSADRIHVVGNSLDLNKGVYALYNTSGTLVSKRSFTNVTELCGIAIDSSHIYIGYNRWSGGGMDETSGVITLDAILANNILQSTAVGITITDATDIPEYTLTVTDTDAIDLLSEVLQIPSFPDDSTITQTTDIELSVTGGNAR
jgi:uncharacterized repeat protein (TIGR02059 family)